MQEMMIELEKVKCKLPKNEIEVSVLKQNFLKRYPIPSPIIDKNNNVVAFANSYYVVKELKISPIVVTKILQ